MNENTPMTIESMAPISAVDLRKQVNAIQQLMRDIMQEGTHYGKIPGCGDKPTLLKPGAEKLSFAFRMTPTLHIDRRDLPNGHREYEIICTLTNPAGQIMGQGVGCCSTLESKYRYRTASRQCPQCGAEAIIKGKEQYGGGWICFKKRGGCGAKFADHDPAIIDQECGKVENPDIADTYNTVLKIAKKRAHVDATITACAAGDIFTQDVEDLPTELLNADEPPQQQQNGKPRKPKKPVHYYTLSEVSAERVEDAVALLERNGAEYLTDLRGWRSPVELPQLQRHQITLAELTRKANADDIPNEWSTAENE